MWADKSWFGLHESRQGSSMYINHARIEYVFFLLVCCQACRVSMLWPGETQVVPGNAGISTTVTDRWPLTSDWKLADWPVNQTAANKQTATPFGPTLVKFAQSLTQYSYIMSADHRILHSFPHIWLQLNQSVVPLRPFQPQRARAKTRILVLSSTSTSQTCFISDELEVKFGDELKEQSILLGSIPFSMTVEAAVKLWLFGGTWKALKLLQSTAEEHLWETVQGFQQKEAVCSTK